MGCTDPTMWRLVPALAAEMGDAYPELRRAEALITETLRLEETRFKAMLDKGLKLLEDEVARLPQGQPFSGEAAFRLYDTYGFPLDLTQDALRPRGIAVDTTGFDTAMAHQKAEARKAWAGSGEAATETVWFELREAVGATEFLGYDTTEAEGQIVGLIENGVPVQTVQPGRTALVVVNQTPFYGESGGQSGDTGVISAGAARLTVTDTQKKAGDLMVHIGTVEGGPLAVGNDVHLAVDSARRDAIRAHHSATHLLHAALRRQLGEHVTQKGSLVGPDRLRFDISHPKALEAGEIRAVEHAVNSQIRANRGVATRLMGRDAAVEAGAMALFGEKYGDEVRVVTMGGDEADPAFSVELCGGTHVRRTGDIGALKIVAESAVGAGVRRIEAVAGEAFLDWAEEREALLARAAEALKSAPAEIPARIAQMIEDRRRLERELADTRKQLATGGGGGDTKQIAGITFAGRVLDGIPAKDLKGMADEIKKQIGSGVVALMSADGGKASLVVGVTPDLTDRFNAVDLVKAGCEALGGKGGGGRPDMAQAGGPDAAAGPAALARIEAALGG
jgi:alanyl-tRNA synthetase